MASSLTYFSIAFDYPARYVNGFRAAAGGIEIEGKVEWTLQNEAIALAASKGYAASQITKINLADDGSLASVEMGADADGFGIFILNFAL